MNKRVLFGLFLTFSIIVLTTPVTLAEGPTVCFRKRAWYGGTTIPLNTNVQWLIEIEIHTDSAIDDVVVTDRLGAELEIDLPFPASITHGTASYTTQGGSNKVFLTWNIGDLPADTYAAFTFWISTDINPAGKQEYTSCGCYELNSGATIKYYYMGVKYSASTSPITISVTG